MDSSSDRSCAVDPPDSPADPSFFNERRAGVDSFVAKHFTWPGTLYLHSAALGWDIPRAALNVVLSLVLVLTLLLSALCRGLGLTRVANWLSGRRILLRTTVALRVETLVLGELLDMPHAAGAARLREPALLRAIMAEPRFRQMVFAPSSTAEAEAKARRILRDIREYAGVRSAVAEMTTTLCVIGVGFLVFQALTPGMISMAPGVAEAVARATAIADFPLGQSIGDLWYSVFTAETPPWLTGVAVVGLVMTGSILAAFAGVFADPVQSRLGIHRRRLQRLLDTLERHCREGTDRPFLAREHFAARLLDFWDACTSLFRIFRG